MYDANKYISEKRISIAKGKDLPDIKSELELDKKVRKKCSAEVSKKKKKENFDKKKAALANCAYISDELLQKKKKSKKRKLWFSESETEIPIAKLCRTDDHIEQSFGPSEINTVEEPIAHKSFDEEDGTTVSHVVDEQTLHSGDHSDEQTLHSGGDHTDDDLATGNETFDYEDDTIGDETINGGAKNVERTADKFDGIDVVHPSGLKTNEKSYRRLEKQVESWKTRCLKAEKLSEEVGLLNRGLQRKIINCQCNFGSDPPEPTFRVPDVPAGVEVTATQEALLSRWLTPQLQLSRFVSDLTDMLFTKEEENENSHRELSLRISNENFLI